MNTIDNINEDGAALARVDALLAGYGAILDAGEISRWPELFSQECSYAIYPAVDYERGLPLAYMLDDCHARLRDRVTFVNEVWKGTVESYRTRHVCQRTSAERDLTQPDLINVSTNFLVAFTQADGTSSILCSGSTEDTITLAGESALFNSRRVLLDGTPARYLVYPL